MWLPGNANWSSFRCKRELNHKSSSHGTYSLHMNETKRYVCDDLRCRKKQTTSPLSNWFILIKCKPWGQLQRRTWKTTPIKWEHFPSSVIVSDNSQRQTTVCSSGPCLYLGARYVKHLRWPLTFYTRRSASRGSWVKIRGSHCLFLLFSLHTVFAPAFVYLLPPSHVTSILNNVTEWVSSCLTFSLALFNRSSQTPFPRVYVTDEISFCL